MHVLCWFLFVGICLKAGTLLFSGIVSMTVSDLAAKNLFMGLDLLPLLLQNQFHYIMLSAFITLLWSAQAFLVYLVLRIFAKINFMHPFSIDIANLVSRISYVALAIGLATLFIKHYVDWLNAKVVYLSNVQSYLTGGAEFILLGIIIFVISQVFKRGIEIQTENELTV